MMKGFIDLLVIMDITIIILSVPSVAKHISLIYALWMQSSVNHAALELQVISLKFMAIVTNVVLSNEYSANEGIC